MFEYFEIAFAERDPYLKEFLVHPLIDPYRDDPRAVSLLKRMNLL
jgi:hypothetical protein